MRYFANINGQWQFSTACPVGVESVLVPESDYKRIMQQMATGLVFVGDADGFPVQTPLPPQQRLNVLTACRKVVDDRCKSRILNGFEFPAGTKWSMSANNQTNLLDLWQIRGTITDWPQAFKSDAVIINLTSASEIDLFYRNWVRFKQQALSDAAAEYLQLGSMSDQALFAYLRANQA